MQYIERENARSRGRGGTRGTAARLCGHHRRATHGQRGRRRARRQDEEGEGEEGGGEEGEKRGMVRESGERENSARRAAPTQMELQSQGTEACPRAK